MTTAQATDLSGGFVEIPGDSWLLDAEYVRMGPDLILKGGGGEKVMVRGFFTLENPPALKSESGAVVTPEMAIKLAGPLAPAQVAQAAPAASALGEPIGAVETLEGTVEATHSDGAKVTLQQGDSVFQGDVLESGAKGAIGIIFIDESIFSMGKEGRMTLDDMVYDAGEQTGSAALSLMQGAFTFVSGQIAKTSPEGMVITTPTAVIGIRGSAGGLSVNQQGHTTAALMQEKGGFSGELTFTTGGGTQVINQPFQAITVTSFSAPPPPPFTMSVQEMGASFGGAMQALPNAADHLPDTFRQEVAQVVEQQQAQAAAEEAAVEEAAAQAEAEAEAEAQAEAEGNLPQGPEGPEGPGGQGGPFIPVGQNEPVRGPGPSPFDLDPFNLNPFGPDLHDGNLFILDIFDHEVLDYDPFAFDPFFQDHEEVVHIGEEDPLHDDLPPPPPPETGPIALTISGTYNGSGETRDQIITGGAGNDTITTGSGNDTITGGGGGDDMNGGDGYDIFKISAAGNDFASGEILFDHGTTGTDTVKLTDAGAVDFSVGTLSGIETLNFANIGVGNQVTMTDAQMGAITNFTNLGGSNDQIILGGVGTANFATKTLTGLEQITGSAGNDVITGSAGNDTINGGGGNDILIGGAGNDTLTGSVGSDVFRYTATSEFGDTINDFVSLTDDIDWNITNLVANNTAAVDGSGALIAALGGSQTAGAHIYVVNTSATDLTAAAAITAINTAAGGTFTAENAADQLLFAVNDGTHSVLWQADMDASVADTSVTAAELTQVATLSNATLATGDFI